MHRKFIILIVIFFSKNAFSQIQPNWGAFNYVLDAKPYAGKNFRIEAAVKVKLIDSTADAEVWVRVDREGKKMGFFNNMMDKPIRSAEWKVYTQTGKIDKDAERLVFGGHYHKKGIFWFDDFKLFIENEKGNFERVPITAGSFEEDTSVIKQHWTYARNTKGFILSQSAEEAFEGKHSYKVDGSSLVADKFFGSNDDAGKYAYVNGIKIYYEIYGNGTPLLLLHGNRSPIASFYKQIPELSKYFKVIAVDTRGQGRSSEDGKTYTYDLFAKDMNALLDELNVDSVNILGWSDGGNTGLIMAMKYPKKIRRLVTMGADVFIDSSVVDDWVFKEVKKQLKEFEKDTSYISRNNWRLANLLITEPNHTFNDLKNIKCPVLVMAGEKDIIKVNHTKGIAANIPKGTLYIAPKQTHYFPQENAEAFNKIVKDFLLAK